MIIFFRKHNVECIERLYVLCGTTTTINFDALREVINSKQYLQDDVVLLRTKSKFRCQIYILENEYFIRNCKLHTYEIREKQYAHDAFFTNHRINYEYPLNGYITSSTPYNKPITKVILEKFKDETMLLNSADIKHSFPFFTCIFYTNSHPIVLGQSLNVDYTLIPSLSNLYRLIHTKMPDCMFGPIGRCIVNEYFLVP